jgi:hypothetical protein
MINSGLPPSFAQLLGLVPGILIFTLLCLLYFARRPDGRWSLKEAIQYREKIPLWQYIIFVPLFIIWSFLIMGFTMPVYGWLNDTLFFWIPGWLGSDIGFGIFTPAERTFALAFPRF